MTKKIKWQGVVLHHTNSHDVGVDVIRRWHQARGWDDIGYHFLIRADGRVEEGRSLDLMGIHARGRNHTHIGVALTGCFSGKPPNRKTRVEPTEEQIVSLVNLLRDLYRRFDIPLTRIERHHASCPGDRFPFETVISEINSDSRQKRILDALDEIDTQMKLIKQEMRGKYV